jgi:proliferating cell nuclear antigen
MLKSTINGKNIKDFVDGIYALVQECRIHINEKKITTTSVDSANVALARVTMSKDAFLEYIATPSEMCINLTKIREALNTINSSEYELMFTESSKKLQISGNNYTFTTLLIADSVIRKDPSSDPSELPLPCHIQINGNEFSDAVRAVSAVSDKIAFSFDPPSKRFSIYSVDETESITKDFEKEKLSVIKGEPATSMFSMDYMRQIAKMTSKADALNIHIGNNMPIKFEFAIGTPNYPISIMYLIAPRIESA